MRLVPSWKPPKPRSATSPETKLGPVMEPMAQALTAVMRVHDAAFVEFLETGYDEWRKAYGDSEAIPAVWVGPAMRRKLPNP